MKISPQIASSLESRYAQLALANEKGLKIESALWTYLQESEVLIIEFMGNTDPGPYAKGNIEVCWALYFLNNDAPSWIVTILQGMGMPQSKITSTDWTAWEIIWKGEGKVYGDGSFFSYAPYAMLDGGWCLALIDYLLLSLNFITRHPFGTKPQSVSISGQPTLRIAVFGDWGTGNYADGNLAGSPSQLIGHQISKMSPDISIHLGDVYYSGTSSEELTKLVETFPEAPLGNFTLNSNHEMYNGANGYFDTALANKLFEKQQGTSYFKIEFGDWLIVGLDSAYYDKSQLFMDGAITDEGQVDFLRKASRSGKKVMLLTHHNPIDYCGNNKGVLWNQVLGAMDNDIPAYWYWGHQHNGIVYQNSKNYNYILCRCLGNGAIPIGNATWLENNGNILAYTSKGIDNPTPDQVLRVMNGFAILEFTADGVTENWYYQDGTPFTF
jgi:hypothetical protein